MGGSLFLLFLLFLFFSFYIYYSSPVWLRPEIVLCALWHITSSTNIKNTVISNNKKIKNWVP